MILTDFLTQIDYRRRDITTGFIGEVEKIAYLNEGLRKTTGNYEYEWSKVSASISYVDGSSSYALSSVAPDLDEPIDIFHSQSYDFQCVSPADFKSLSASSYNIWAIDNDALMIKTTFGTATLTLNYYTNYTAQTSAGSRLSGLSSTDDSPLMPELYQDIIVDFAMARCFQKEQMYDDYRIAYNEFLRGLQNLQVKTPSRKKHYSKVIENTRRAGGGLPNKANVLNM